MVLVAGCRNRMHHARAHVMALHRRVTHARRCDAMRCGLILDVGHLHSSCGKTCRCMADGKRGVDTP